MAAMSPEKQELTSEERTWAMVTHLGPLVVSFFSAGLLCFMVPLVIYLVKREESEFIGDQAKESLNFRITWFMLYLVLTPITIVLILTGIGICIAVPMLLAAWVLEVVFAIVATAQAMDGVRHRYPLTLRLVS
jgi:uncharacterized Tic20 family protein